MSHSPSASGSWAETVEEEPAFATEGVIDLEDSASESGGYDDVEDDEDGLRHADAPTVAYHALEQLGMLPGHQKQDKPDIWTSQAFNRPLLGTENDKGAR